MYSDRRLQEAFMEGYRAFQAHENGEGYEFNPYEWQYELEVDLYNAWQNGWDEGGSDS